MLGAKINFLPKKLMKTFLIDWGDARKGAQYGLAQAGSIDHLEAQIVQELGIPQNITELHLPRSGQTLRYVDLGRDIDLNGPALSRVAGDWLNFALVD